MHFGAAMFFTDYSMGPGELGQALEERGFESVWVPEHSHIPTSLMTPFPQGGELPKKYYDAMDPFVALTVAAVATRSLKIGTGVCLVAQRDPIQTAKACRLDRPGLRRPLFVRGRRGLERGRDGRSWHRVQKRFKLMRERIAAMKEIRTKSQAEYHGEFIDFPPMMTWPKPVQQPHPPVVVGGAFPHAARRALAYGDGWIPHASRPQYTDVTEFLPRFYQMAAEAGRAPESVPVTVWGVAEDSGRLRRHRDLGVARVVVSLPSAGPAEVLPIVDRWAELMERVRRS